MMDGEQLLRKLAKELDFFEEIYDSIRLVDPTQKKVHSYLKPDIHPVCDREEKCYGLWEKGACCENCISMRVLNQNRSIVKIAYNRTMIYLVTAVPVHYEGKRLAIELLKDITHDGIIDVEGQEIGNIHRMIDRQNSLVVREALYRIYNENYIYEKLPNDILTSQEEKRPLALFFMSINNLKAINDIYGYKAGDYVIKEFLKLIGNYSSKEHDWTARYSGLEFLMVMFDIDQKQAYRVCKRIHDKITKFEFCFEGRRMKIEFSIGYHVMENERMTPDQLITTAGKSLYATSEEMEDKNLARLPEELLQKYLFTQREREVVLLLLQGCSNSEIAQSLFVGISTVKKHIANIFDKAKVKSRSEFISHFRY